MPRPEKKPRNSNDSRWALRRRDRWCQHRGHWAADVLDSARSCEVLVAGPGALTSGAGPAFPSLTSNRPSLVLAWFPRSLPAVARRRRYPAPPPAGPLHEGGDLL